MKKIKGKSTSTDREHFRIRYSFDPVKGEREGRIGWEESKLQHSIKRVLASPVMCPQVEDTFGRVLHWAGIDQHSYLHQSQVVTPQGTNVLMHPKGQHLRLL